MRQFMDDIFGDAPGPQRRLARFTVPDRRTRLLSNPTEVEAHAGAANLTQNVYIGMGLIQGEPKGRGKVEDIAGIGCLWADIDLVGEAHPRKHLPANIEEAKELLAALPLAPSILVDSGHGLHAYWLLNEPWLFESPEERAKAARLTKGWHGAVCATAAARGWALENLGDLTRILRLPGTINRKIPGKPVEVRIIERNADLGYNPGDFEPFIVKISEAPAPVIAPSAAAEPPADKLAEALAVSEQFRQTWERQWNDSPSTSLATWVRMSPIAHPSLQASARCGGPVLGARHARHSFPPWSPIRFPFPLVAVAGQVFNIACRRERLGDDESRLIVDSPCCPRLGGGRFATAVNTTSRPSGGSPRACGGRRTEVSANAGDVCQ